MDISMNETNPLVSVIIPTYNRARYIVEAVKSVLNQTYQNIEVIIIDDASTDNTAEQVKLLHDNRVQYVQLNINEGAANARNYGVELANGEYIAFQDSDDLWTKDKLECQLRVLLTEDTDMCFCAYQNLESHTIFPPDKISDKIMKYHSNWFPILLTFPLIGTPTILCKRACFLQLGGFEAMLRAMEDYEFTLRFSRQYKISYLKEPLLIIRRRDIGVNGNAIEMFKARCFIFKKFYKYYFENDFIVIFDGMIKVDLLDEFFKIIKAYQDQMTMEVWKKEVDSLFQFMNLQNDINDSFNKLLYLRNKHQFFE